MESGNIKRLGLILAVQAEIKGMEMENLEREQMQQSMAYNFEDFRDKAEELRTLSYCHEDEL